MVFDDSGRHPQWPKVADTVIEAYTITRYRDTTKIRDKTQNDTLVFGVT